MLVLTAWTAWAQTQAPGTAAVTPAIATVGTLRISKGEFEQRASIALSEYEARSGSAVPGDLLPMIRRQILEGLIRTDLLTLEAQRRNLTASEAEAESQLKLDPFFSPGGRFDENRWNNVKSSGSPAFQDALRQIRLRLAAQKYGQKLERDNSPPDSLLRATAERSLRHVSFDYLALRGETFDGGYPEPREYEILNYYRSHAGEFRRPDRAVLSMLFIDQPPPPPGLPSNSSERRAWDVRMMQVADSALTGLRSGASFDTLGARFGVRRDVAVTRDNFPGYWQGGPQDVAAVFTTRPGEFLHSPVAGRPGYLVVRVDAITPTHTAPLVEVSREIRTKLRAEAAAQRDERELRPIYNQLGDSLAGPAIRVRYAVIDTGTIEPGQASEAELDRYYRGHIADYSSFDAATASIRTRPLVEVRDDVLLRWRRDRRVELSRLTAEGLQVAWTKGRRDPALERSARLVREVGPIPIGAVPDTGAAAAALSEALRQSGPLVSVGSSQFARGSVVYEVIERLPRWRPTLDQARAVLIERRDRNRAAEDLAGGRQLFESQRAAFVTGNVIHFSRLLVTPPDPRNVTLTRAEVERYHRRHFDKYSASEMVEARHILISPTGPGPAADAAARARADSILARIRAGEDFATLARRTSDDPATRERGGDLGSFGRGVMLDEFERAAFGMNPGEVTGPVRSPVGYHIIKCVSHLPTYSQPLEWIYGNVGYDAALEKADSLAARRADSLFRNVRTIARARSAADQLKLSILPTTHPIGQQILVPELIPFFNYLEGMKPGELYPGVIRAKGMGFFIAWVDSITPPEPPTWESSRDQAIEVYRRGAGARAMRAKCAELDTMLASGWSFDSLATLWGGLEHAVDIEPGAGIKALGGAGWRLDSLAFGAHGGRPLRVGERSGWQPLPVGYGLFLLREVFVPNPGQLAARMQNDRRIEIDRRLHDVFEGLKQRYPVRILDPMLSEISLPPIPSSPLR